MAACFTFIYRISSLSRVEELNADTHPELTGLTNQVRVFRFYGALFFGAVKLVEDIAANQLPSRALVLDFKNLIYIDTSGADALRSLMDDCDAANVRLLVTGLAYQPLEMLQRAGLTQRLGTQNQLQTFSDVWSLTK